MIDRLHSAKYCYHCGNCEETTLHVLRYCPVDMGLWIKKVDHSYRNGLSWDDKCEWICGFSKCAVLISRSFGRCLKVVLCFESVAFNVFNFMLILKLWFLLWKPVKSGDAACWSLLLKIARLELESLNLSYVSRSKCMCWCISKLGYTKRVLLWLSLNGVLFKLVLCF